MTLQKPTMKYDAVLTTCEFTVFNSKGFLQLGLHTKGQAGHLNLQAVLCEEQRLHQPQCSCWEPRPHLTVSGEKCGEMLHPLVGFFCGHCLGEGMCRRQLSASGSSGP